MDRLTTNIASNQLGFIDIIVPSLMFFGYRLMRIVEACKDDGIVNDHESYSDGSMDWFLD